MSKFKVGDKVTPIVYRWANCVHPYLVEGNVYTVVRTEVELVDIEGIPSENVLEAGAHNTWRYDWDQCHFKLADGYILSNAFDQAVEEVGEIFVAKSLIGKETEMNAEQIRDEILRIDTRIEEAKKDIENAEKEHDSLVEKLREMGFELTDHTTNNLPCQKLTVGDTVRILPYNREYHDGNCVDQTAEVISVDNSGRPYYVRTESDDYFWCSPEEVEKI